MNTPIRPLALGCCALLLLTAIGCLKREETITVMRDGRVHIRLEYEGDAQEFESGDAMPTKYVTDRLAMDRHTEEDGDEIVTVKAEQDFAAGSPLPANHALLTDPDADLYLQFPTRVWTERTREGTYYNFARTYVARPWAYIQYWQDVAMEDDIRLMVDKPVEELSLEQRVRLIRTFVTIEAMKQVAFAKDALHECAPALPQRHRLLARQKLLHLFVADDMLADEATLDLAGDDNYVSQLVARCDALPGSDRDACYEQEADRVLSTCRETFVRSLRDDAGLTPGDIAVFLQSYDRARRRYEITDLLGGHALHVCVKMPGTLVAHNADSAAQSDSAFDGASEACWEVEGKAMRDRNVEMMVTSFVPATRTGK